MKQIIIDENYEISYKDEISDELSKKILTEATKYYSAYRLEFDDNDIFKTFTYEKKGKKYRIVVAKSKEVMEKNIKEIVETIHDNTAFYVTWDSSEYSEFVQKRNDSSDKKATVKLAISWGLTLIINILLAIAGIYSVPFVVIRYIIGIVMIGAFCATNDETVENVLGLLCSIIIGGGAMVAMLAEMGITALIENIIADIKNNTFSLKRSIKKIAGKVKELFTHKKNKIEEELDKVLKEMDDARIAPVPYRKEINKERINEPKYIDPIVFSKYLKEKIGKLPFEVQGKYYKELDKIISHIRLEDLINSDQTYNIAKSKLMSLYDEIESYGYLVGDEEILEPDKELEMFRRIETR